MTASSASWWIFCRVIDNLGDAGVAWRLARQLSRHLGHPVDLVIDHPATLARLEPELGPGCAAVAPPAAFRGVRVWSWTDLENRPEALDTVGRQVLVSAFSCELPEAVRGYLSQHQTAPLWILFEYLSAERWVDDCHARPSPLSQYPGPRFFYFPGFTHRTGGLLREDELLETRDSWQRRPRPDWASGAQRWLTLWAYPDAPWPDFYRALERDDESWGWCLFEGTALTHAILAAQPGPLPIRVVPFQTQAGYDNCLWEADLNLVRGEDSFVRAQWAGKPLLWQIYPQPEGSHWPKLEAFLDVYLESVEEPLAPAIRALFLAWNGQGSLTDAWAQVRPLWGLWELHARHWSRELARQPDLVTQLVEFVEIVLK